MGDKKKFAQRKKEKKLWKEETKEKHLKNSAKKFQHGDG
jgi:hypothetical protein